MGDRELRYFAAPFRGWGCTACGWARPLSRFIDEDMEPSAEVIDEFQKHDCSKNPRKPKREN